MLIPRKVKYRKQHHPDLRGKAQRDDSGNLTILADGVYRRPASRK